MIDAGIDSLLLLEKGDLCSSRGSGWLPSRVRPSGPAMKVFELALAQTG